MNWKANFATGKIVEMIQRLQSIFLLLGSACLGGTFYVPYANSAINVPGTLFADSIFSNSDSISLVTIIATAAVSGAGAIFLFHNRKLQKRVCWISIILALSAIGLGIYIYMKQSPIFGDIAINTQAGAILPIVAIILDYLAIHFINKDEKLVRSADRLR